MKSIGIITGDMQENKTGMGTYMSHLLLGISDATKVYQIHHQNGDLVPGCASTQPYYPLPYWYLSWSIATTLSRYRYDIIHNIGQYPVVIPSKINNIVTVHDLIPILYPEYVTPIYSLQARLIFPKILQSATKIIAVSEHTKQDIISKFHIPSEKICVIYHGVSDHFYPRNTTEVKTFTKQHSLNNPFVLFTGSLEPRKNLPNLIKAFAICLVTYPSLELVIAGQKSWKFNDIFSTIKDLHLEQKVRILDFVPYNDLPLLYSAAKLFVYPSLYEGFGLPPLEAMKCGTPVIVSNHSSLPEIVGDTGITVDPQNYMELAAKINIMLDDEFLYNLQAEYLLLRSKQFTWKSCVKNTLDIYESIK